MPELPEVETVRRGLNQTTLNQPIWGGEVLLERTIASPPSSQAFLQGVTGTTIHHWHRRGKYLLAALGSRAGEPEPATDTPSGGWLGVHLRMTGQLLWLHPNSPLQTHTRLRLWLGEQELRFVDSRTFGRLWWVPPGQPPEAIIQGLKTLGPEPFSDAFSLTYLVQQFDHRRRPVKNALLDQAIAAGVGNIYADEALFLSGIRPETLCADLSRKRIARLHAAILQVLKASIDARGTTLRDFRDVEGINGNYGGQTWVYDRDGQPCRQCGTVIQRLKLAGRSAHFCPKCQK